MELDLVQWLQAPLLTGARIGSLLTFAPFLGSNSVSPRIKAGLTFLLAWLAYPALPPVKIVSLADWAAALAGEMAIGFVLGLCLHFIFDAALLAGHLVGFQTGLSLINLIDPTTEVETTVFSVLHQVLLLLIFLQLDIHHWLLRGLLKSFTYLPPGTLHVSASAAEELLRTAAIMWLAGLQIAAPVIAATLLADLGLGFLSKASPQLPVLFIGFSLKALLGMAVLAASLVWWPVVFERWFAEAIAAAERILALSR